MPLTPASISAAIQAASPDLKGTVWAALTAAIGVGIVAWAANPVNMALTGVTSGTTGVGKVTGKFSVVPAPLPVSAAVSAAGLVGFNAATVARAVGMGVANAFNSNALYQGVSAGVGVGADTAKVSTSNSTALVQALSTALTAVGITGMNAQPIASALGTGLAALLATGTGIGVVAGGSSPIPAAGTSTSKVT